MFPVAFLLLNLTLAMPAHAALESRALLRAEVASPRDKLLYTVVQIAHLSALFQSSYERTLRAYDQPLQRILAISETLAYQNCGTPPFWWPGYLREDACDQAGLLESLQWKSVVDTFEAESVAHLFKSKITKDHALLQSTYEWVLLPKEWEGYSTFDQSFEQWFLGLHQLSLFYATALTPRDLLQDWTQYRDRAQRSLNGRDNVTLWMPLALAWMQSDLSSKRMSAQESFEADLSDSLRLFWKANSLSPQAHCQLTAEGGLDFAGENPKVRKLLTLEAYLNPEDAAQTANLLLAAGFCTQIERADGHILTATRH